MRPVDPRLFRAVPQARRPVGLLAVAGIAQGVATVGTAFALGALVTAVASGRPLAAPAVALAVTLTVRSVLSWLVERTAARAGVTVSASLRHALVATWLRRPQDDLPDPTVAGTLAAQGSTSVETYVARFVPALVHAAVVPALATVALLVVDWPSAVVVALTLPLLPVFASLIGRTTQEATQRRWQALSMLAGHFLDVVQGLPTLVAYGRGERQVETVRRTSEQHRVETMATLRLAFLSSAALELLATISVALVAVTVGIRLAGGSMDLQPALVAILLAPEAYWPIRRVGAEFHASADGVEALSAILTELERPAETLAPATARPVPGDAVVVDDVTYRHPGRVTPALEHVSLRARTGLTVVTGPSGVGKSTLLEVLAGLRRPESGTVETPRTHLVTQRPFLVPGSVRENLALGACSASGPDGVSAERLWTALRHVGLDGVVAGMPRGLDTAIGDDGFGLSAGQRARLGLARAMLSRAPVLLLDEPTAHLDAQAVEAVQQVLAELAADRVVVAVSHEPSLVALADQIVELAPSGPRLAGGVVVDPAAGRRTQEGAS